VGTAFCTGESPGFDEGQRLLLWAQINRARWRQVPDPCRALAVTFRAMSLRGMNFRDVNFRHMNAARPDRDGRNGQGEPAKASKPLRPICPRRAG
jgi:hypothetical protein